PLIRRNDARAPNSFPAATPLRGGRTSASYAILAAMKQDERAPFVQALLPARVSAYPTGEYVEQESFMTAGEIRILAREAGIGPGVSVLDLCCGVAGPGRLLAPECGGRD